VHESTNIFNPFLPDDPLYLFGLARDGSPDGFGATVPRKSTSLPIHPAGARPPEGREKGGLSRIGGGRRSNWHRSLSRLHPVRAALVPFGPHRAPPPGNLIPPPPQRAGACSWHRSGRPIGSGGIWLHPRPGRVTNAPIMNANPRKSVVAGVVAAALSLPALQAAEGLPDQTLSDYKAGQTLRGAEVSMKDLEGRVVVFEYWGTQ